MGEDPVGALRDKLAAFYQIRMMLEEWKPAEYNEDTHILFAIRDLVGLDNSTIDPEWW